MNKTIPEIVREAEEDYILGQTQIGEYVNFNLRDKIETIIAYLNSTHITGDKDSLGREKPFFNIVTAATNIWYRATDIDRKDVVIRPAKKEQTLAVFLATAKLQEWMNKTRFAIFLNEWGRILAQFGSAVVKFVEKDGELECKVIPWNRMIVDAIDFDALPRIEKIYKTPAQLKKMKEINQDEVESLLTALTTRKNTGKTNKDSFSGFVELYEVHGELSLENYKKAKGKEVLDGDDEKYFQQFHLVSFVKNKHGDYDDFTLYVGREKQDPYMLTHLIKEEGRVMSIGAVEYLFNAQWMMNHSVKNMKDTLDLASKIIFQTADGNFVGRNVLSAIETGDIMVHTPNNPLTQINNSKADITAMQNFAGQWRALSQELTSTPDSLRGTTLPSNTPYSLGAYLGAQAGSLFEIMTEQKGLYLEDMLRKYIIPHLKTKLNTKKEVISALRENDIKMIDSLYVPIQAAVNYNKKFKEAALSAKTILPFDKTTEEQAVGQELAGMGNTRAFQPTNLKGEDITWFEVFKGLEWDVEVGITNEPLDKQAVLTSLSTLLQSFRDIFINNPDALKMIAGKILNMSGVISPVELSTLSIAQPAPANGANMGMAKVGITNQQTQYGQ